MQREYKIANIGRRRLAGILKKDGHDSREGRKYAAKSNCSYYFPLIAGSSPSSIAYGSSSASSSPYYSASYSSPPP